MEVLGWLRAKLADAEKSLRAREQSEATFRSGTDESWAAAAELHSSTRGKPMNKKARLEVALIQGRIAGKCRREVEMFKAVIAALDHPNDELKHGANSP